MTRPIAYVLVVFGYLCGQNYGKHWYSVFFFVGGMLGGWLLFVGVDKLLERRRR